MSEKKQATLVPTRSARDPFSLLRQMTSELDRVFDDWPPFRWPAFAQIATSESTAWWPKVDVFERDNRLVTRVDLPGMKKEDVAVEVTDGHLALSGERKREKEEKKDVLEVSVPLPPRPEANVRKGQIEGPKTAAKSAA